MTGPPPSVRIPAPKRARSFRAVGRLAERAGVCVHGVGLFPAQGRAEQGPPALSGSGSSLFSAAKSARGAPAAAEAFNWQLGLFLLPFCPEPQPPRRSRSGAIENRRTSLIPL